ncbi:hypothetical protein E4T43_00856 [Aureobasidium subglaciale]|nr:hypothetical protein E4T43_00856 [Aureobasidium subglaciale]
MGQSMLGWKADDFFVAVKQHLDAIRPGSLGEISFVFGEPVVRMMLVLERLNSEKLDYILENTQHMTEAASKTLQQLDLGLLNESFSTLQHAFDVAIQKFGQIEVHHIHDTLEVSQSMVETVRKHLQQLDVNQLHEGVRTFQKLTDNIVPSLHTFVRLFDVFMVISLLCGVLSVLTIIAIIYFLRSMSKHINDLSDSTQIVSNAASMQGTLNHQRHFAEGVYNLIELKDRQQYIYPNVWPILGSTDYCYLVYHPASDWHPSFFAGAYDNWNDDSNFKYEQDTLIRRVHLVNNPTALLGYLQNIEMPESIEYPEDPGKVVHILLPSTHAYTVPFTIRVPERLRPVRVVDLLQEHEAPDYTPSQPDFNVWFYPIVWFLVAGLWIGEKVGQIFDQIRDVAWTFATL